MKNTFLLSVLLVLVTTFTFAQESKYQLSSHIKQGQPATGVKISLSKQ